jgi:hypothetical protein
MSDVARRGRGTDLFSEVRGYFRVFSNDSSMSVPTGVEKPIMEADQLTLWEAERFESTFAIAHEHLDIIA